MTIIKQILMQRDGISAQAAQDLIDEAKMALEAYIANNDQESAENVCQEYLGLEPDYLIELM